MTTTVHPLISVPSEELRFKFELEKQSHYDLKIVNNTEHHVAFKVKTTSPKKYFVRPNTSVIQPWDACFIKITLQAQQECPPDMQCKDKFLLQSTIVPPNTDVEDLASDTFNKGAGRTIEECKLRVVYVSPNANDNGDESGMKSSRQSLDSPSNQALQQLKDEREAAMRQTQLLQQELDMLRRRRNRKNDSGFSFKFALIVALIGLMVGFLLNLTLSTPST